MSRRSRIQPQRLYDYVGGIWDGAKQRGLSPADLLEYDAVAASAGPDTELVIQSVRSC